MQSQPGQLVTPEAVVLHVAHAGPGTRIGARGLDALIQVGLLLILFLAIGIAHAGGGGGVALVVISLVGVFLVIFGYPAIMEARWRGRTLGKAAFGLRVVTSQGAPIHFRHAAIRSALYIVDGLLVGPVIGVLCLLISRDTVRLGDLAAGTIVIKERSGATHSGPVSFGVPFGSQEFVSALDVSGLSARDYSVVREFLLRAPKFAPAVRHQLAIEIANPIALRLHQAPSMDPEVFLNCVAAASQLRSGGAHPVDGRPAWGLPAPSSVAAPVDRGGEGGNGGFAPPT